MSCQNNLEEWLTEVRTSLGGGRGWGGEWGLRWEIEVDCSRYDFSVGVQDGLSKAGVGGRRDKCMVSE